MDKAYTVIAVNDTQTLLQHRDAILGLFSICFGQEMNPDLWDWAYQKNPCGAAYVQLAYKDEELVGHYAMIPQVYCNRSQQHTMALSMTTMVHPSHRRSGLFQILAEATYDHASQNGLIAVLGFPNSKSTPGFKKRLQWQCNEDYKIVKTRISNQHGADQLHKINLTEFCEHYQAHDSNFMLNLKQQDLLAWRLSKPDTDYLLLKGEQQSLFIVKSYTDTLDVVFASTPDIPLGLHSYAQAHGYTALVTFTPDMDSDADNIDETQYRFGYRSFHANDISFAPQLIMSDVF